ncbi:MAG: hypothetical protein MJZ18_02230 [Bacteroidales bacterium]|nr:hypothetical protein [Bacteroidales bacterium]
MNLFKQLINLNLIALVAAIVAGCASSEEKDVKQMVGQVICTQGDSMLVVVAGKDTISMHSTIKATDMPLEKDSVVLYYVMDNNGLVHIEDVIVLNHNEPVLNNVTAMLIGKWEIDDIEGNDAPFKEMLFDKSLKGYVKTGDGILSGIDWLLKGKNVTYGNGVSTNSLKYRVLRVDANTLTVTDQVSEYRLRRLFN